MAWAIKWRSENRLDGKTEHLMGRHHPSMPKVPDHLAGYTKIVFSTRQGAREFIREHYGYIRERADLRREPHGWKMPVPVQVTVQIEVPAP